ncbi:MAG: hypothetical protein IIA82_04555 [Thaumarchaeota archaeon]|nr:hypothetical protein [Nitrososphaerota archaeon]
MPDLVFFGAGASRPFEIPTMQEMVTKFEEDLKEENELFNYYSQIKKTLSEQFGSGTIDIEAMLSVIEGISKGTKARDLGHFALYYISKIGLSEPFDGNDKEKAKKLLDKLKKYIKNSCTVNLSEDKIREVYEQSYVPLFGIVTGNNNKTFHGKYNLATGWKSYTTNYDNIFEYFWNSCESPQDHFDQQPHSDNYSFNTGRLVLGDHSFTKLHGSLDWTFNKENGSLIKKKSSGFLPYQTGGDVMLFPIQQKDLYLFPWYALFQDFKSGLMKCEKWYVVGYAFNDEFILNSFIEQLKLRNEPSLIIIGPSSKQIIRKFPEEVREKIIALPIKFGSKYFSRQIQDFVEGVRTLTVKVKTTGHSIGFKSSIPFKGAKVSKINGDPRSLEIAVHTENKWIEKEFNDGTEKEIEFQLKIEHTAPFENDLELQVGFDTVYDYDFSIHIDDHFLNCKSGNTSKHDQDLQRYLSEPIKIYSDSLFIKS